jgi:CelD/BcsL family acetyltransferase involved in cellulose biosynthesis
MQKVTERAAMNAAVRVDAPSLAGEMPADIARIEVFDDLDAVEPLWRSLETEFATPFQRFGLLAAWQRNVGVVQGFEPRIVAGFDAQDRPLCILPFAVAREAGVRVAHFMGGKHCNFNMGLWRRDAAALSQTEFYALFKPLAAHGVDMLALTQQIGRWQDRDNPFIALPRQPSVNGCPVLPLAPGAADNERISGSTRRRLKSKERKLQSLSGYRYLRATTQVEVERALEAFFRLKPQRMALQNLPNVFAEPGVADFVRRICDASRGEPQVVIHMLECDDEVIAMFTGVEDGRRFSMMFNTYTLSDNARYSPGLILIRHIIDHYAAKDFTSLDLGVGSDPYKTIYCKDNEELFDSFIPLTARGWPLATALALVGRTKQAVKRSSTLLRLANMVRAGLRGAKATQPPSED